MRLPLPLPKGEDKDYGFLLRGAAHSKNGISSFRLLTLVLSSIEEERRSFQCAPLPRARLHAAHAACSYETCPQIGQLSSPSRSVVTSSGGQQRGHRLNPNSPPSVALAIRRSFPTSQRNFPKPAGASPVAESFSRAARTFSETTVIERSEECRASMSMTLD